MEYDVEVRTVHRVAGTGNETVDSVFRSILSLFDAGRLRNAVPGGWEIYESKRLEIGIKNEDLRDEDSAYDVAEVLYEESVGILTTADYSVIRSLLSGLGIYGITDVKFVENEVFNDELYESTGEPTDYTEYVIEEKFGRLLIDQKFRPKFFYVIRKGLGYGLELSAFYHLEIDRDSGIAYITAGLTPRTYVYYGRTEELLRRAVSDFEWVIPRQIGTTTIPENLRLENGVTYYFEYAGLNDYGRGIYELVKEEYPR